MKIQKTIALSTLCFFACQSSYAAPELKIKFDGSKGGHTHLSIVLFNNTNKELCIDGELIGLDGHFDDDLFNVRRIGDASPVEFYGIQAIRTPQERHGLALLPGRTVTVSLDLSTEYDLSRPGTYTAKYRAWNIASCDHERTGIELTSESLRFVVPLKR